MGGVGGNGLGILVGGEAYGGGCRGLPGGATAGRLAKGGGEDEAHGEADDGAEKAGFGGSIVFIRSKISCS